jgi:hypothetical protein
MNAYKFLRTGRVAPFTAVRWEPGVWVEAEAAVACEVGVHACRREDLPFWLQAELWEVELDGEIVEAERKLVASRGRLVRRVDRWDRRAWTELARACARRTRALAKSADDDTVRQIAADAELVLSRGDLALVPYFASVAAERAAGPDARLTERAVQAAWIAENVLEGRRRFRLLRR